MFKKYLLIICLMAFSTITSALEVGLFAAGSDSDQCCFDNKGAGVYFQHGDTVGAEAFVVGSVGGVSLTYNATDSFRVGVGAHRQTYTGKIDVGGVDINVKDSPTGNHIFVQYSPDDYFVRVSYSEDDFTLTGNQITTVPCFSPECKVSASKKVSSRATWLWVGMRF